MQTVIDNADLMWRGLRLTLQLSLVVIVAGTLLGLAIGVGLLYGNRVVRSLLRLYVDLIRGLPLLVLIFLLFYGLPALEIVILGITIPTNFGRFTVAAVAFSMRLSSSMAMASSAVTTFSRISSCSCARP